MGGERSSVIALSSSFSVLQRARADRAGTALPRACTGERRRPTTPTNFGCPAEVSCCGEG